MGVMKCGKWQYLSFVNPERVCPYEKPALCGLFYFQKRGFDHIGQRL